MRSLIVAALALGGFLGSGIPGFLGSEVPGFLGSEVRGFQGSEVPKFQSPEFPAVRFTPLLQLGDEIVFAYARISGDGRFLVYSSEPRRAPSVRPQGDPRVMYVYDLVERRLLYQARGIDGYWSPDGIRLIYAAFDGRRFHATIWNRLTGDTTPDVMSSDLGDYYSWGRDRTGDLILTIEGWIARLNRDGTAGSVAQLPSCPGIGRGLRPLLSRDGQRATVFVRDELVLRNVADCSNIITTGVIAGKADWSADGRYVAFHTPKKNVTGYELGVVDSLTRSAHRVADLAGSSYFPSWTDDGGLVFRYDGPEYKGFVRADRISPASAAQAASATGMDDAARIKRDWQSVLPAKRWVAVLLWAAWGAHSRDALTEFGAAEASACPAPGQCAFVAAHDPTSRPADVARILKSTAVTLATVQAPWDAMRSSGGFNQNPSYLVFDRGCLAGRTLGAMSKDRLAQWLAELAAQKAPRC